MFATASAVATAPNFKTALIHKVFFIRWEQPPSPQDLYAVDKRFREAYEAHRQQMCVVVTTGAKARVPNGEQRKGLFKLLEDNRKYICELHLVMEGNELQHNLQRIIASAQLIVTRIYDNNYARLHKDANDIAPFLTSRLKVDGNRIINDARLLGLVI
ncbi:DofA protein [Archangium sp.]|uniref:DofA protein n=1 Tax=Archangium sp. TaxID=1872627 RepID=UPI002D223480|nr:DofA protein [Archangium sp.]HYO53377.1 DofA protein [Archangium sp.]